MKKALLLAILVFATTSIWAQDVSLSFATFKSPENNYIELNLHVVGKTLTFAPVNDSLSQGALDVTIVFKQEDRIVKFDKFSLKSPISPKPIDFIDLKRYTLDNGDYQLEVEVKDANTPERIKNYSAALSMEYKEDQLMQSDIQLLASFKRTDE